MLDLITDIEKALKHNCFRSAIGLALTLPDICGQVAFPSEKSVGKRYAKWCDEHVNNQKFTTTNTNDKVISGKMCYKLRCSFLHSGNLELNQQPNDSFPLFELRISSSEDNGVYIEPVYTDKERHTNKVVLDLRHLCKVLCNAAKEYYEQHEKKSDFNSHHVEIIDVEKISQLYMEEKKSTLEYIQSKREPKNYNELSPHAKELLEVINENRGYNFFKNLSQEEQAKFVSAGLELFCGGFIQFQQN